MDIERVKDTIRKLMDLAKDDAATEGEVRNAMRFAAAMMEKHQLTEDDLPKADQKILDLENSEFGKQSVYSFGAADQLLQWNKSAARFVCDFVGGVKWYYQDHVPYRINGIQQVKRTGTPTHKTLVTFYGIAEDVEIAKEIYEELCTTIISICKLRFGMIYRGSGRDYCEGFMEGLYTKWYKDRADQKQQAKQLQSTSGSTALVVIDKRSEIIVRKTQLAEQWLNKTGTTLRTGRTSEGRGRSNVDHDAKSEGRLDGSKYQAGDPNQPRRKKLT